MLQVRDGAVIRRGKDIIPFLGGSHSLQIGLVVRAVAGCPQQGGKSAAGTGAVGNDFFRIPGRQPVLIIAQITHGRLVVHDKRRRLARIAAVRRLQRTPADGRCRYHIALGKGYQCRIAAAMHGILTGLARLPGHVTAYLIWQEDGGRSGGIAVDGSPGEIGLRHIDIHGFIGNIHRMLYVDPVFIGPEGHCLPIGLQGLLRIFTGIQLQAVIPGRGLHPARISLRGPCRQDPGSISPGSPRLRRSLHRRHGKHPAHTPRRPCRHSQQYTANQIFLRLHCHRSSQMLTHSMRKK